MSLGQAIAGSLGFLQGEAKSMMTDSLVVKHRTGESLDDSTGIVTPVFVDVYSGKGRVKPLKRISSGSATAGEAKDSELVFIVSLPIATTGVLPGHVVTVAASNDPSLLEITLRVVEVERGSAVTARRLTCELVEARA